MPHFASQTAHGADPSKPSGTEPSASLAAPPLPPSALRNGTSIVSQRFLTRPRLLARRTRPCAPSAPPCARSFARAAGPLGGSLAPSGLTGLRPAPRAALWPWQTQRRQLPSSREGLGAVSFGSLLVTFMKIFGFGDALGHPWKPCQKHTPQNTKLITNIPQ